MNISLLHYTNKKYNFKLFHTVVGWQAKSLNNISVKMDGPQIGNSHIQGGLCIKDKEVREIIGYTFENEKRNSKSWYECALSFHECASMLYGAEKQTSRGAIATFFNAALSIELILKAILAAKKKNIPQKHNLRLLVEESGVKLNDNQYCMIDYLTEAIIWLKYPTPRKETQWDNFHDVIFEKFVIKIEPGKKMANLDRIPSLDNYMMVWNIFLTKYEESVK